MRLRNPPPKSPRALLDLRAFHEAFFVIFSLGLFLALVGLYFPFFCTPIYGSRIVNLSPSESFYLVPVPNAGPVFGRIIPGLIADKAGSLNTIIPLRNKLRSTRLRLAGHFQCARSLGLLRSLQYRCATIAGYEPGRNADGHVFYICWAGAADWESDRGSDLKYSRGQVQRRTGVLGGDTAC